MSKNTELSKLQFTSNVSFTGVVANNTVGSNGQVLTSNGTSTYWADLPVSSLNTAAQYTWTNTHTFNANVEIANTSSIILNANAGSAGQYITANSSAIFWGPATKTWHGKLYAAFGDCDPQQMLRFAQMSGTTGALPDPFPTVASPGNWTGGFPLFFLDNDNT